MELPNALPNTHQVQQYLAQKNLKDFTRVFWSVVEPAQPFIDGIHLDAVCDHLTAIDDIRNLLICIPPGFAKSLQVAVHFFCWRWLQHPHERFLYASHNTSLAVRDSRRCRQIIASPLYQAYWPKAFKIVDDQDTKVKFENDKTGWRMVTSVDAGVTGERADFAIVDDPHNLSQIESKAERDNVIRWYSTAFSNRVVPQKAQRIIVMQMAHVEDLANNIIRNDTAANWTKLVIPLEAGRSRYVSTRWQDPRTDGELLCPALFSKAKISEQLALHGRRNFNAQYNQNPAPAEDALFNPDGIRYYTELPPGGLRIAAVDLAISTKGDYTVIAVADVHRDGNLYLVHLHRERMPGPKILPTIKAIHATFGPTIIYIEDVAFQRLIIQEARTQGLPVRGCKPEGDKVSRSVMLQVKIENGQLWLPRDKPYVKDIVDELAEFPNAAHDDQVDALSYIAIEANTLYRRIPEQQQEETAEEKQRKHNEEFQRRVRQDEERLKQAFFSGLKL